MWLVKTSSSGDEHRRALPDPVERQPRLGVDARRAQDRQRDAVALRPVAQPVLGRDAAARARRLRRGAAASRRRARRRNRRRRPTSKCRRSAVVCFAPAPARRSVSACAGRRGRRTAAARNAARRTARRAGGRGSRSRSRSPTMGTMPCARSLAHVLDAARESVEAHLGWSRRAVRSATSPQPINNTRITLVATCVVRADAWRGTLASERRRHAAPDYHKAQRSLVRLRRRRHRARGGDGRRPDAALRLPQRRLRHVQGQDPRGRRRLRPAPGVDAHRRREAAGPRALLLREAADRPRDRGAGKCAAPATSRSASCRAASSRSTSRRPTSRS